MKLESKVFITQYFTHYFSSKLIPKKLYLITFILLNDFKAQNFTEILLLSIKIEIKIQIKF